MMRGLKRTLLVGALFAAAYVGFRWGGHVFPRVEEGLTWMKERVPAAREPAAEEAPTPELAEATLDRFERFRRGESGERLALGGVELSSVVRYALPGIVPPGVAEPSVSMEDGRVRLRAQVARAALPRLTRLESVVGLLPDTMLLEVEGTLVPHDGRTLALLVDRVAAARIPLPPRLASEALTGLGSFERSDLPPDALPVPLPGGVRAAFVQRDSLVLLATGD